GVPACQTQQSNGGSRRRVQLPAPPCADQVWQIEDLADDFDMPTCGAWQGRRGARVQDAQPAIPAAVAAHYPSTLSTQAPLRHDDAVECSPVCCLWQSDVLRIPRHVHGVVRKRSRSADAIGVCIATDDICVRRWCSAYT